ncbi:MAG: AcrB/AcrD/AcrF family protein [Acidobacteriaceae bacterium]|nr:AcrB/AcrD/AcrF family protein [Acidobacteriaceae bacterium]
MFIINSSGLAIAFCVLTMVGWGSWANTQKLAGKESWPFELFYWDYAIGVAIAGLLFLVTLGVSGSAGMSSFANLASASPKSMGEAIAAGALFNLANILLVAAIDAAGMSIAFPVGIGLALIIGTAASYIQTPKGNLAFLSAGVALILVAIVVSAVAHRRMASKDTETRMSGLWFAIVAGLLMGFFYPELTRSISPGFNQDPIRPGLLTPYTALLFFGIGVLLSSIPFNWWFMRSRHSRFSTYIAAKPRLHFPGILGGIIWMIALGFNLIAAGVAGPAVSYALGQGATLIAALWGVFIWHEFRDAPAGTNRFIVVMFATYTIGIILIGRATLN